MTREETVRVRAKGGGGAAFAAGRYALVLAAGEAAERWADGSPITRAEFNALLAADGAFEMDEPRRPQQKGKEA